MRNRFSKTPKQPMQALRSRVLELRNIPARLILGASWNFRVHPENQQEAVAANLDELGFTSPLLTYIPADGQPDAVRLVDGHLRQQLISDRIGPDTLIPCIVTDLSEAEAKRALLTHDPLGAMAGMDAAKLDALLLEMETESPELAEMLEKLAKDAGCKWAEEAEEEKEAKSTKDKWNILVECESEQQQTAWLNRLADEGLKVKSLIA